MKNRENFSELPPEKGSPEAVRRELENLIKIVKGDGHKEILDLAKKHGEASYKKPKTPEGKISNAYKKIEKIVSLLYDNYNVDREDDFFLMVIDQYKQEEGNNAPTELSPDDFKSLAEKAVDKIRRERQLTLAKTFKEHIGEANRRSMGDPKDN